MHATLDPAARSSIVHRDDVTQEEWEEMLDARDEARLEAIADAAEAWGDIGEEW